MAKILDDIVKTCNEIDAKRNKELSVDAAAVKTTAETIGTFGGDPEQEAAADGIKESEN